MARKKRFIVFGFALLLTGFLIAVDIALAARTVEQLARSEVYVRTASPQIWRSHVSHMAVAEKQKPARVAEYGLACVAFCAF